MGLNDRNPAAPGRRYLRHGDAAAARQLGLHDLARVGVGEVRVEVVVEQVERSLAEVAALAARVQEAAGRGTVTAVPGTR